MREIVHIQIGQCGNQLGLKFWSIIANEHGLSNEGLFMGDSDLQIQGLPVYFIESASGKFVPRAILVDLEPSVLEKIRNAEYGTIFRPDNFINGFTGASNNYAHGYYSDGADILDNVLEIIRKETETCESIQGFQLFHSIGGGTGSGLGSLILNKLSDEYPDRILCTYTVFPSPEVSDVIVEPYNALLSIDHIITLCNETFVMDNEALFRICKRTLKLEDPVYGDLNHIISNNISGITTSLRFTGQLNADLRKLATNLVPYPRFHFFITSFAPMSSRTVHSYKSYSIHEIIQQAFDCRNILVACNPKNGKYLTIATMFRGKLSMRDIDNEVINFQNKNSAFFVEWIPHNVKTSSCDIPPRGYKTAVTFIGNSTAIQDIFNRIEDLFVFMYSRRAYMHWYLEEGMEELEFQEAERNLLDLIDDYESLETAQIGELKDDSHESTR